MDRHLLLVPVLLIAVSGCADQLVLTSNHDRIDPGEARRKVVTAQGRSVECWVARSPGAIGREPRAFVLFFVGKGDRADRWISAVAGAWGNRPVELWGMNYPGSGGTDGPPRLDDVGPDALAVYDALRRVAGTRPIFVHAGSFGTTVALCVAARRPVAGLVLQNPPPLRELILGQYGWWNLWLIAGPVAMQIPADLDSIANARRTTAPAIFLLSGSDEIIPPAYQRKVVDAYAGPKQLIAIPGANHNSPLPREAADRFEAALESLWDRVINAKGPAGFGSRSSNSAVTDFAVVGYDIRMSQYPLPGWAQEQIAEIEAQVGRQITPDDLACVDINEAMKKMTVARNPLLAEVRCAENDRNDRRSESFPEYQ